MTLETTHHVADVAEMLDDIAALAPRAKAINERYAAAHQDRRSAETHLITEVIDLVVPYLSAITGWREEIKLRGVDLFPSHLIIGEDGQLYEQQSGHWLTVGPEAIRPKEIAEFVAALADLFGGIVRGKAPAKTAEQQRLTEKLLAVATLLRG